MLKDIAISKSELAELARLNNVSMEKTEEYQKGVTLGYAKNKLYGLIENSGGRLIIANKKGENCYINKNSVDKMLSASSKSIENNFSAGQHFAAVADIINLYKNSVKVLTHPDKKGSGNIGAIHRYVAPLYDNNIVYITVKEVTKVGNKIYSIELMELGKLEGKFE